MLDGESRLGILGLLVLVAAAGAGLTLLEGGEARGPADVKMRKDRWSARGIHGELLPGEEIFRRLGCATCHAVTGSSSVGVVKLASGGDRAAKWAYLADATRDHGATPVEGYAAPAPDFSALSDEVVRLVDYMVAGRDGGR